MVWNIQPTIQLFFFSTRLSLENYIKYLEI